MNIRQWISGKELMERWKIKPLDLVEIVLYERLTAYEADGKLANIDHESAIWANHAGPWPPWTKVENPTIYDFILNSSAYDFKIPHISIPHDYIPLASRIEQCMFKISEVNYFEKEHNLILQDVQPEKNDNSSLDKENKHEKKRKKTKVQLIREKVREKARELWQIDPTMTIADMFVNNEISKIAVRENGEIFVEKTIRDWIKDLCPDRSHGRRPKKNPKKGAKDL